MKHLLKYLKQYKKETILAPLFKLLEACFELFVPLVIAMMVDKAIGGGDRGLAVRLCLLLGLLAAVGLVSAVTAQFFAAKAAVGFAARIKHALFGRLQSMSFSEIDAMGTPAMITRMTSDVNQVQTGVNLALRLLLRSPFIVFGAAIMAFTIDTRTALYFVLLVPLLAAVVFAVMLYAIPLYAKVQKGVDRLLSIVRENLTGARVIRAFVSEDTEREKFREGSDTLVDSQLLVGRISSLMNPATYVLVNGFVLLLVRQGALRVDSGAMTQGEVIAMYNYMAQILVELIKLANLIITITRSAACAGRIATVLEQPAERACGEDTAALQPIDTNASCAVEFRSVSLRYRGGGEEALGNISLSVKKGETVGIIGGTGSGKTSLANLIPAFYEAAEGEVRVFGADVARTDISALRRNIGIVPQKALLFAGTIRDNLLWGREDATEEELMEAVELAQAADIIRKKEKGLDSPVEQGGSNFSGGQRQRLTIARALVRKPAILILDDSASALDFATDAALRRSLRSLDYQPTVFIVSQRASSVMHADTIVVLDNGCMVGCDTHERLLETCPVYKEIYLSQNREEASA
ncbi:MAG: ABC transporter ATP-binding protein [Ruminococcaceae bacterium]|nr:ABC transporter ATP-binding protein [Oscillospiraceae bacterium]